MIPIGETGSIVEYEGMTPEPHAPTRETTKTESKSEIKYLD